MTDEATESTLAIVMESQLKSIELKRQNNKDCKSSEVLKDLFKDYAASLPVMPENIHLTNDKSISEKQLKIQGCKYFEGVITSVVNELMKKLYEEIEVAQFCLETFRRSDSKNISEFLSDAPEVTEDFQHLSSVSYAKKSLTKAILSELANSLEYLFDELDGRNEWLQNEGETDA